MRTSPANAQIRPSGFAFRYDASYYLQKYAMKKLFKPSLAKAIFTDEQFWVPVVILTLGLIFLVFVDKP